MARAMRRDASFAKRPGFASKYHRPGNNGNAFCSRRIPLDPSSAEDDDNIPAIQLCKRCYNVSIITLKKPNWWE